jgi:class 3 adenylate cyclase
MSKTEQTAFIRKDGLARPGPSPAGTAETASFFLDESGRRHSIREPSCLIGRSNICDIVLANPQVSARHALVHHQAENEFVLVDLGSSNGTFADGQQVVKPVRLRHLQDVRIGDLKFTFCNPNAPSCLNATSKAPAQTVRAVQSCVCWLLLLDIVDSTELSNSLPPHKVPVVFGAWFSDCRKLILESGGTIDKFLGDSLFAYWKDDHDESASLCRTIEALIAKQRDCEPPFRWILHRGEVSIGGTPGVGSERVMGREVNFAFRLEKLAGSLKLAHILSQPAARCLQGLCASKDIGQYRLKGFDERHSVFVIESMSQPPRETPNAPH